MPGDSATNLCPLLPENGAKNVRVLSEEMEGWPPISVIGQTRWVTKAESDIPRWPGRTLVVLLLAVMSLVLLLAIQAWANQVYHRELSHEVLRDYGVLAADEALRRLDQEVGYYGLSANLDLLRRAVLEEGGLPDVEQLESRVDARSRRALSLVEEVFLLDSTSGETLIGQGRSLPSELVRRVADTTFTEQRYRSLAAREGTETRDYVVGVLQPAADNFDRIGYVVDEEALRSVVASVVGGRPLLPASLGEGDLDNSVLALAISTDADPALYVSSNRYEPYLSVERKPEGSRAEPFQGLTVLAAIDPAAAHRLVIGGLPASRLPILLVMIALAAGLLLAAIVLIRRERTLIAMRSDFVSRVSHELRTPLAQMRLFSETLLQDRARNEEERRRYLEILVRETRRLTHLVDNVLRFSGAEHDNVELDIRETEVEPWLKRLIEDFQPLVMSRQCSVETRVDPALVAAFDPDAVQQAMLNLVDNAVKYGPAGQCILIRAEERTDHVLFVVEDEGPGIPKAELERVWQTFHRAPDPAGGASPGGTGIGLSVVRDIVARHGGKCWIEALKPGPGLRVVIELPRRSPASSGGST